MEEIGNKEQSILERYSKKNEDGTINLDVIGFINEVEVRFKTNALQIKALNEGLGAAARIIEALEERVDDLTPKIKIVSENEAKSILKG